MNDLLSVDGVLPIPHKNHKLIYMGSQWAPFMPTFVCVCGYKGAPCVRIPPCAGANRG